MCSFIINARTIIITYDDGGNDRPRPRDIWNKRHREIFGWFLQIIIVDANIYASFVGYETKCGRYREIVIWG